jgi:hypothetical protein
MKKLSLILIALLLLTLPATAANQSTIDPTVPATDADLDSTPIRTNFLAAWNDINALWSALGNTLLGSNQISGALVAGPVEGLPIPNCNGTSSALQWVSGVGFACNSSISSSNGSVSSVAFVGDGITDSATPSSAVTNVGNLVATALNQSAATFLAGPVSGGQAKPSFRLLVGTDLPFPGASSLGGVLSATGSTHNYVTGISGSGALQFGQPVCSDLANAGTACVANTGTAGATVPLLNGNLTFSGAVNFAGPLQINGVAIAPSATIDATNASNITSGSLANNRLTPLAANQMLGAVTATTPGPLNLPSCNGLSNALTWTPGTGFGCNNITAGSSVFSSLLGAITTGFLDNVNLTQTWAWSTLGSNTGLGLTTSTLTSGTLFSAIVTSSASNTGYAGYFSDTSSTGYAGYFQGNVNITGKCTGCTNVTSASPSVVITPTPGTGTFTVGLVETIHDIGAATSNTVLSTDMGKTIRHNASSSIAETLPQAGSTGFESQKSFTELNIGSAAETITPTTSNINGSASLVLPACSAPPACPWAYLISDGTNWAALVY